MKFKIEPKIMARRGTEVKEGNVYANRKGQNYFDVVIAILERDGSRPWNNVCLVRVDIHGKVWGVRQEPERYVSEHKDLVGRVAEMPELKVEWFKK